MALKAGKKFKDFLTQNMITGKTGNEILANALKEAKAAGLRLYLYTSPWILWSFCRQLRLVMWDSPKRGL